MQSGEPKVIPAFVILDWFDAMNLSSEIATELKSVVGSTSDLELECYWTISPFVPSRMDQRIDRTLGWPTLTLSPHPFSKAASVINDKNAYLKDPAERDWAAYFLYWKTLDILPEDQSNQAIEFRSTQIYKRYYPSFVAKRDYNADQLLSPAEMLTREYFKSAHPELDLAPDGTPLDVEKTLSEADAIAFMVKYSSWLDHSQRNMQRSRNPSTPSPNPAFSDQPGFNNRLAKDEPIYQGKPLSHWLHLFDVERDPKELGNVTNAINALVAPDTKNSIRDAILKVLPERPNQTISLVDNDNQKDDTYLDIKSFKIIYRCTDTPKDYVDLVAKLYKESDPKWSSRVLYGSGFEDNSKFLTAEKDCVAVIDFGIAVLSDPNSTESAITYCQRMMVNFANKQRFSDETNQRIVDFMIASDRFDNSFWFSSLANEIASPRFIAAVERKAISIALAPGTTDANFSVAIGIAARIREMEALQQQGIPVPQRSELVRLLADRLQEFAGSAEKRRSYQFLEEAAARRFEISKTSLNNFSTQNGMIGHYWPGGVSLQFGGSLNERELQVLTILRLVEAIKAAKELEDQLAQLIDATAASELECFQIIKPTLFLAPPFSMTLNWQKLSLKRNSGNSNTETSEDQPTQDQWADYLVYWKAVDLMSFDQVSKAKRTELLKARNGKLYAKYCDELFQTNQVQNGTVRASVLLENNNLQSLISKGLVFYGQHLKADTLLTKERASELLNLQLDPPIFGF